MELGIEVVEAKEKDEEEEKKEEKENIKIGITEKKFHYCHAWCRFVISKFIYIYIYIIFFIFYCFLNIVVEII
jgi:predicted NodU family carbamoyl transferase